MATQENGNTMNKIKPDYEVMEQLITFYSDSNIECAEKCLNWIKKNRGNDYSPIRINVYEDRKDSTWIGQVNGHFLHQTLEDVM